MRSKVNLTASAVNEVPSWNLTSLRRWKVYRSALGLTSHRSASPGTNSPAFASQSKGSRMESNARHVRERGDVRIERVEPAGRAVSSPRAAARPRALREDLVGSVRDQPSEAPAPAPRRPHELTAREPHPAPPAVSRAPVSLVRSRLRPSRHRAPPITLRPFRPGRRDVPAPSRITGPARSSKGCGSSSSDERPPTGTVS